MVKGSRSYWNDDLYVIKKFWRFCLWFYNWILLQLDVDLVLTPFFSTFETSVTGSWIKVRTLLHPEYIPKSSKITPRIRDTPERIRAKNVRIRIHIHIRDTPNFAYPYIFWSPKKSYMDHIIWCIYDFSGKHFWKKNSRNWSPKSHQISVTLTEVPMS